MLAPHKRYEYHHTNALGSNIVLTDDNKNVLVRYEYDVFGAVRSEVGTGDTPRKFTGKEYESDVKLYYYAARYYDPYIGRFTQRDPARDGLNWYAYANNNPLAFVDPTGMYITLPGGTEIKSVPGKVNGSYVKPGGLEGDDSIFWDALFTLGVDGTGIAGSNTAGGMLKGIIESPTRVNIQLAKLPEDILGTAKDMGAHIRVEINNGVGIIPAPGYSNHLGQMSGLIMTLVHDFSHAHDYNITKPGTKFTSVFGLKRRRTLMILEPGTQEKWIE